MSRVPRPLADVVIRLGYGWAPKLASRVRKFWVKARNPSAEITFKSGCYLGPGFSIHAPGGGTFVAGHGVHFRRNFRAELAGPDSSITIGDWSYLTYDVVIACASTIEIGERCGLGQCTFVVDGSHRYRDRTRPFVEQGYDLRPLRIDDDAQIHSKCTIINDVGKRAIIAANAVVTKPIPPWTVAGGVPARVIDYYGPPGEEPEGWRPDQREEPRPSAATDGDAGGTGRGGATGPPAPQGDEPAGI